MKTRTLLTTCLLVMIGHSLSAFGAPRPNILYIYVDDMGWGSLGPNAQAARKANGQPYVVTPNLDRLAAESINFSRAYGCTVCSPARSSQQTGFHQGHTFADRNDPDNAKKAIRSDDVTIGDVLSKAGYTTGYWGKWGYGGSKDQAHPVIENVQTLPTSHGYEFVLAELHHVRAHTFFQPTLWGAPATAGATGGLELIPNSMAPYAGKSEYPDRPALQNHADYPETAYCDDSYCFAALDFVRAQAKNRNATDQPFFGLLAVQVPHAPFGEIEQLPEWNKAYADNPKFKSLADQTRQWAAMVTRIDGHIGNLLDALDDPNGDGDSSDSVAENTLVIFQSDNGGPSGPVNQELDTNGGLRGVKGSIYEGGIRVPTMMRWPAKITSTSKLKAGTSSNRVIDVSDFLPTFCELAGAETPVGLDGVSLAATLLGEGEQRTREFVIHEAGKSQSIIRGKDKLVRTPKGLELYDLAADRAEEKNLVKKNAKLAKELETLLLGERVDEARGFANTYHYWTGANGAGTSDPDNWSDYVYANAGITYLTDDGAPQVSWSAVMENSGDSPTVAKAAADLEFLSLEIRGGKGNENTQELILGPGINLTGRNEVRLSKNAILTIDGGAVSSLRWVEVKPGAELRGTGKIEATLYNAGAVTLAVSPRAPLPQFAVNGDYRETNRARLSIALGRNHEVPFAVAGNAALAGILSIEITEAAARIPGVTFTLLKAGCVSGRFSNPGNRLTASDGTRFVIGYSETAVTLSVEGGGNS